MSLSDLPTELIVHVFKSVDNIRSAAVLSQTSHHFHSVWRYNLSSICDSVIPREIECYDQARQLLEARAQSDIVVGESSLPIEEKADAAILRVRMLFTNADHAYEAVKGFEAEIPCEELMTPEEFEPFKSTCTCDLIDYDDEGYPIVGEVSRSRFLQGYYRALTMIYLARKCPTKRYRFLESMHLLDFFRMLEIMEWIVFEYMRDISDEGRALPGYDFLLRDTGEDVFEENLDGDTGDDAFEEHLDELVKGFDLLEHLETDLAILSGIKKPMNMRFRHGGPSYQLILHEDCVNHDIRKAESIALAHLLPRLPKNSPFSSGFEVTPPN